MKIFLRFLLVCFFCISFQAIYAEKKFEDDPGYVPHTLPNYNKQGALSLHLNTFFISEPRSVSVPAALRLTYSPVENFSIGLMAAHYRFMQTIPTEKGTQFVDDVHYRHFFGGVQGTFFITDLLHNHFGLNIHPDFFNIYVNAYVGYSKAFAMSGGEADNEFMRDVTGIGKGFTLGFRSLFTDTIGFFAEGGYTEYGYLQAGVSFLIVK